MEENKLIEKNRKLSCVSDEEFPEKKPTPFEQEIYDYEYCLKEKIIKVLIAAKMPHSDEKVFKMLVCFVYDCLDGRNLHTKQEFGIEDIVTAVSDAITNNAKYEKHTGNQEQDDFAKICRFTFAEMFAELK